jgi:zinc transport system substrate-binding protein
MFAGCGPSASGRPDGGQLEVFVSVAPLADLVERIGGEHVEVNVLVEVGQDPHTFEPAPRKVRALAAARLFFRVQMPFEERLLEQITAGHDDLTVIDLMEGIEDGPPAGEHDVGEHDIREHDDVGAHDVDARDDGEHDHGDHHHGPGEADPHVWLSPPLLLVMADHVARALTRADPDHAAVYAANRDALCADIRATHQQVVQALAPYRGGSFYVFHPAFGHFGQAYGLTQKSVEVGGKTPTPRQLRSLIQQAQTEGVKIIFVQPQFDPRAAEAVAEAIGGAVVTIDPLRRDVLANLRDTAAKVASALQHTTVHQAP